MHLILPEQEVCEEKERNYAKCIAPDQMLFFQPLVVVLNRNASPRPLLMNTLTNIVIFCGEIRNIMC